jgi:hypothetical protein
MTVRIEGRRRCEWNMKQSERGKSRTREREKDEPIESGLLHETTRTVERGS